MCLMEIAIIMPCQTVSTWRGERTSVVKLTSSMRKYECNCWTNPVVYKKPSSSSSGGSSSCKFLRGTSARAVGMNNVDGWN